MKSRLPAPLIAFPALALYLATVPPSITWENRGIDSGEMATAAYYLGVAHPTGYPLFVLLGFLTSHLLPIGDDPAFRLNLLSACCASATIAILAGQVRWVALRLGLHQERVVMLAPFFSAGLLAVTPLYWSQSLVIKEYALHPLLFVLLLGTLFHIALPSGPRPGQRWLLAIALLAGLGLANHVTVAALVPATLLVLWRQRHAVSLRPWGWAAAGGLFLAGLCPYLLLPIRARQLLVANWGSPATLPAFLNHVTGADYHRLLFEGVTAGVAVLRLPALARMITSELTWPGFLLALVGLLFLWERSRVGFMVLTSTIATQTVFALQYTARDSEVHLIPVLLLLAVAAGLGFAWLLTMLSPFLRKAGSAWYVDITTIAAGYLVLLITFRWSGVSLHGEHRALDYLEQALVAVPDNGGIVSDQDRYTFALWYGQWVLGLRRDVAVVDARLIFSEWYLDQVRTLYPHLGLEAAGPEALQHLGEEAAAGGPDHVAVLATSSVPMLRTEPAGLLFRVTGPLGSE